MVDTLVKKCKRALEQTGLKRLIIAGGVSANTELRIYLHRMLDKLGGQVFYARPEFCTDNGAMVAYAGCQRLMAGQQSELSFAAKERWPLTELAAV